MPPLKARADDEDDDYEDTIVENTAEDDEYATDVEAGGSDPTEFDLALARDVLWDMEG